MNAIKSPVAGLTLFVIATVLLTLRPVWADDSTNAPHPDLTGIVQDASGHPISNALVFIDTAAPKHGPSTLCPSCYADCIKQAVTDADGKFLIQSLDTDLIFRVLVAANGWQPKFVSKVDPAAKPLNVTLKPQLNGGAPNEKLQGRVTDTAGNPVANAVINIRGVTRGEGTRFGGNDDVDPLAVSDASGNFIITSRDPIDAVGVDVEARGFAEAVFPNLATGDTNHILKLTEGATLKGRVVRDVQPLAGVVINVSGANREASAYAGNFSVATDANGKFLFVNLPPGIQYVLCGTMKSLGSRGCIPAKNISVGDDGSDTDVGDITVKPALVLAGQIRLSDGKALPAHQRVLLSRENAWDSTQIEIRPDGSFYFAGVPPELVSLSARVPGYHLSYHNYSLDPGFMGELIGNMVASKTNLILEFDPGTAQPPAEHDWEAINALRQEPLRGAEAFAALPGDIKVTGTVVDGATQQPIKSFNVVEGRKSTYRDDIDWLYSRETPGSNGAFTVYLNFRGETPPAISIEADGYIPHASGLIITGETNLVFALNQGSGPAGVVLQPDGKPAANVKVYLADSAQNGVYVDGSDLAVNENIYNRTRRTLTDGSGHFSFSPQPDDYAVLVIDPSGYAEEPIDQLEKTETVQLQKYARVEGQLMIGSRPGVHEAVNLGLAYSPYAYYPRNVPPLSLFLHARTDGEGKFVFERVPPIAVEISHQPNVRDSSTGIIAESQTTDLALQPGETSHPVLGGKGRPVTGKLAVRGYDGPIDFRNDVQTIENVVPPPAALPDLTAISKAFARKYHSLTNDDERKAALLENQAEWAAAQEKERAFYQSDAGQQYLFSQHRYVLNFSQDGSFRIEDVPAGTYTLQIELHEAGGNQPFNQPVIAGLEKQIIVPDSPGGRSDKPYDLGTLRVLSHHVLKAGKVAPEFHVKTLDGKPLALSDLKGKYVLLDFWATWCGPCVGETPNLKDTWEAYKSDPRFVMVSLSLDDEMAAPRNYAATNNLTWTQAFVGSSTNSDVPDNFGLHDTGIPSIFLIGPDGKIIAIGLRGTAIKAAVASALQ
jgi:thiol-disulfide isomerase/thioredoxin